MTKLATWEFIAFQLQQSAPVLLLYVLESRGSSPGRQGFMMAVNARGEMRGSIGGGIMEHKLVELAKEQLSTGHTSAMLRRQIHDKSAARDQSGMICSGEQLILFYPVSLRDEENIRRLISSLRQGRSGTLRLSPAGMQVTGEVPLTDFSFTRSENDDWSYTEKTGYQQQLSIIGGGHCSLALSQLMRRLDFYVRVYDNREGLSTMAENQDAHEKIIVPDYSMLQELVLPGPDHYVVIMTFGYRTDDQAVKALLGKSFRYTGLLGSASKIDRMMQEYRREGLSEEGLQRISSPAGLSIKSQTPMEIAVSIAAQIIQVKNKYR